MRSMQVRQYNPLLPYKRQPGFHREVSEKDKNMTEIYANHHKNKMIDNYHKIINRDCYGCQKGGMF